MRYSKSTMVMVSFLGDFIKYCTLFYGFSTVTSSARYTSKVAVKLHEER